MLLKDLEKFIAQAEKENWTEIQITEKIWELFKQGIEFNGVNKDKLKYYLL